jgi:zinc transport system substrate-binding protein
VQQIGKDRVDVQVLVEPGADPHTYEPRPQQMVALSRATLYFAVGIEFETAKLAKVNRPESLACRSFRPITAS